MLLFKVLLAGTTLLVCAVAQGNVAFTEWPTNLAPGQPATFKWSGGNGPATITLLQGNPSDMKDVQILTADGKDGEFTWTPKADMPAGSDYAFRITQDGWENYSGLVQMSGDNKKQVSESSGTQTATTSATSAQTTSDTASMTSSTSTTTDSTSESQQPTSPPASSSADSASSTSHPSRSSSFVPMRPTSSPYPSDSAQTGAGNSHTIPLTLGLVAAAALLFF